jgi:hypothetical protein
MKKITESTDRELMERIAINSKTTASGVDFIKNYLIVVTLIAIVLTVFLIVKVS